ncbi:MAG: prolipoprotein diacylglyceryl transferase [Clostridia bacterium]|nr:prolipoprotein diacylglyceryl transferase [Clostridia bacterium]
MVNQISFPDLEISLTVNRAAFQVFGISVYWYGLLIALGLCLAFVYGIRESKRVGLDSDHLLNMILIAVPTAIICARAYYVIFSWDMYKDDLLSIFAIRGGGLAIYGGIIGICAVIFCYCRVKKLSMGLVLDVLAVGLLIGQAIGRWSNFVNGEAFGSFTQLPWAMTIRREGHLVANSVHPTFLYESLWNSVGIVLLLCYKKIKSFNGELFCAYLTWYGLGRVWIEGLRSDSLYIGDFRVSQLLAAATVIAGVCLILLGRKRKAHI